jgi:hypothetical protein
MVGLWDKFMGYLMGYVMEYLWDRIPISTNTTFSGIVCYFYQQFHHSFRVEGYL